MVTIQAIFIALLCKNRSSFLNHIFTKCTVYAHSVRVCSWFIHADIKEMEGKIMTKEAVKVLGTQLKALLERAVGGIYTSKGFQGILTDYYEKYHITEKALEIKRKDTTALIITIDETKQYINYAISAEDFERKETWKGSTFFDYQFYLDGYMICFNVVEKGNKAYMGTISGIDQQQRQCNF